VRTAIQSLFLKFEGAAREARPQVVVLRLHTRAEYGPGFGGAHVDRGGQVPHMGLVSGRNGQTGDLPVEGRVGQRHGFGNGVHEQRCGRKAGHTAHVVTGFGARTHVVERHCHHAVIHEVGQHDCRICRRVVAGPVRAVSDCRCRTEAERQKRSSACHQKMCRFHRSLLALSGG